jgi:hypothetical protein
LLRADLSYERALTLFPARQSRFGFPGRYLCARIPSRRARQGHDLCWMTPLNELTLSRSQNSPLWARTARSNPTAERVIESLRARVPNQRLSHGAVSRTIAIEIVDNHPVISRPVTSLRGWSRFWPRDPVTSMACQEEDHCLTSCRSPR